MSTDHMQQLVARYLAHRRQLGYELVSSGILLRSFARFADRVAPGLPLTTELGYRWALAAARLSPRYRIARLGVLRGLARYEVLFDPRTEVMPKGQFASGARLRPTPHIYTIAQVRWLMRDAKLLEPSWSPLRALTMRTVIGLLWCTGLRIGEAVRILDRDFDVRAATLRIAPRKFSPERIIPIHPTVVRALQHYQGERLTLYPHSQHLSSATAARAVSAFARPSSSIFDGLPRRSDRRAAWRRCGCTISGTPLRPTGSRGGADSRRRFRITWSC